MGGLWSGYRSSKKRQVESCHAIDTVDLNRGGLLTPGAERSGLLEWGRRGQAEPYSTVSYTLTVGATDGALRLQYQFGSPPEPVDYVVRLATTPCHLGGARWWFTCPLANDGVGCGRRVRRVYRCGRYFGCRHCHQLAYRSSQESDSRVYAALRGGSYLDRMGNVDDMSDSQLRFTLKVLVFAQQRLDRHGERSALPGCLLEAE